MTLSEKSSAGAETEARYIPTGNYWGGVTVSSYFSSKLVSTCLSQTALQTTCYFVHVRCADMWFFSVPTVIQGVDIALLGLNNQSFARLMEQRLAPLFMMSHQQGRRFKRATTVGSYTVQVVNATSVAPRYVLKKGLCMCPASICVKKIIIIVHRLRFPVFFSWISKQQVQNAWVSLSAVSHVCVPLV